MGSFKSKEQRTDTIVAIENYTQELGYRYQDSQDRLENVSKEFIEKKDFDSKIQEIEQNLTDHGRDLQAAMEEETALKDQSNSLESNLKAMELEVKTNDEKLKLLEKTYADKLHAYDEELKECQRRVAELEKEAADSNEVHVFRLSKFAKLNGIMKATQAPGYYHQHVKSSPNEDFWISLVDTGAKYKKKRKSLIRRKKTTKYTPAQRCEQEDPSEIGYMQAVQVNS